MHNPLRSYSFLILYLLWKCIILVQSEPNAVNRHKSVSISLWSNWRQTPLYLETCEFLAEENVEYFWNYIDDINEKLGSDTLKQMSPRDQYDIIVELSNAILSSQSKLSMLKFSLSLRAHSPTVAMFNQMAIDLVNHNSEELKKCDAFVELSTCTHHSGITKRFVCDSSLLKNTIESLDSITKSHNDFTFSHPIIYKIDHIYTLSHSNTQIPIAILYGEIGTSAFHNLHELLKKMSNDGRVKYVMRHYIKNSDESKVSLSGYGVELAIKSTEYKAQDDTRVKGEETPETVALKKQTDDDNKPDEVEGFVFSKLKAAHPDKTDKLNEFQSHLLDSGKEIATLRVWELQELSLQTAIKILKSPKNDALKVMRDIVQNFPTEARSLSKISVDADIRREIERNQQFILQNLNLGSTDTALFINGLYYDAETVDVFTLLNIIKKEIKLVEGLHHLIGGESERLTNLIKLDVHSDKHEFQIDIRDGAVMYANDIENDQMYKNWPSSVQDMLRAVYPGMLRNVRRNMFHLVLIIDPSKKESHDILKLAESFYVHKAPVRIGLIFAVSPNMSVDGHSDAGVACLEAFNFISQDKTPYDGLSFLTDVIAAANADNKGEQRHLTTNDVINHFKSKYKNEDLDMIFGADSDYDTGRKLAWEFIQRTGIGNPIKALLNGVVLKETHLNAELFEEVVLTEIMKQTNIIQKAIYKGELTDSHDILDWLMTQSSVMPRLNKLILNHDDSNKYIDFTTHVENINEIGDYNGLKISELQYVTASEMRYITNDDGKCKPVTLWIAVNSQTKSGRNMLLSVLSHLRSNSINMRLGIIYNGFGSISKVIEASIKSIDNINHLLLFLTKFLNNINQINAKDSDLDNAYDIGFKLLQQNYADKFSSNYKSLNEKSQIYALHSAFCIKVLNIGINDATVVLNGRVINIPFDDPFIEDDFSLIEKYAMTTFAEKIMSQLSDDESNNPKRCSDLVMKISSVLLAFPQSKTRHDIKNLEDKHSALHVEALQPNQPSIEITVITDPLTRGAQKIAPMLITFHRVFNCEIKLFFNCIEKHSELPLKNFFRFVIDAEPNFGNGGIKDMPISRALFSSVPTSPLLTLGMATPENWLVESVKSLHDLDNIHLEEVDDSGIWADFELEHLLLEGHCFELSSGNPPRGLQFTLGTNETSVMVDTIVMANLGYFQLKANPGNWILRLRNGRSSDLYNIISHEGTDSSPDSPDVVSLISNFRSNVIKIRVNKKPGKQYEELLYDADDDDDDDDSNSLWNSFSWSSSGKEKKKQQTAKPPEDGVDSNRINIFSLASGHLYERLLRIMMLSVLKHTKTPVKFWFLKNYLSPSIKEVLPYMAKKYNFEYELVQYKWPRWLHQQTEKQRIIWGYKILFLDVLFPLDVKKIIFVDADQVVRTDLKELRDLDLEGAPYGYTPFCESRKEMDGYRFWKTGYWSVHLHGRKYHISALYVVDLQKFRRIAAGDRLRGQYQGLSQDPNSLSNLDQDLPNNMIHQVSIKSLPQDWLWCETWCDDGSKKTAKTIDLCNNPKTKEPKLTAARRIISEWESYDNEIKQFLKDIENNQINDKHSNKKHESHTEL